MRRPAPPRVIEDLSVMIAGKAGDGVLFTGNILARLLKRHGWEASTYRDFPSNIRGETTTYVIRASRGKDFGLGDRLDLLLSFDGEATPAHLPRVDGRSLVFHDGEEGHLPASLAVAKDVHRFPLRALARERFGQEIFKNMLALGALAFVLDLDCLLLDRLIAETFLKRKGEEVVRKNVEAAAFGYVKAREMAAAGARRPLARRPDRGRILISGDEAIAFGALAAGCRFFAAYPICPATEIYQWLTYRMPEVNGVVVQTEDELAALNMALGAGFAGARAMTATSGPGAALMSEAFSLAGMAEVPVVIAHVQRLGPATGIPTKTSQGDVLQWIFGAHGEFPRIVLAPGTVGECFELTVRAFNLAEKYQCPVIILTDLDTGQNFRTTPAFDLSAVGIERGKLLGPGEAAALDRPYLRYELTADGISPRALPSFKGTVHIVESLEHDERGYRSEDDGNRVRMMGKRLRKIRAAARDLARPRRLGARRPAAGLIGFGSTTGAILEAMEALREKGIDAGFLQLRTLWPFPAAEVSRFIESSERVFVVESNFTGELATLIRSQIDSGVRLRSLANASTRSFLPGEIVGPVARACR